MWLLFPWTIVGRAMSHWYRAGIHYNCLRHQQAVVPNLWMFGISTESCFLFILKSCWIWSLQTEHCSLRSLFSLIGALGWMWGLLQAGAHSALNLHLGILLGRQLWTYTIIPHLPHEGAMEARSCQTPFPCLSFLICEMGIIVVCAW